MKFSRLFDMGNASNLFYIYIFLFYGKLFVNHFLAALLPKKKKVAFEMDIE